MLPNVFPGAGETPEYNTADASLWFFEAWRAYFATTQDLVSLREAFPVLADMIRWHLRGTRYGIGVDPADGLLRAGQPGVQLTWMDAKVGDWVVTPRIGKPVEVNALWYNALCIMSEFATRLGEADPYAAQAATTRSGFGRFIRADGQGLYDVIDGPDRRRCQHPPQPGICSQPAAHTTRTGGSGRGRGRVPPASADLLRIAVACSRRG